ncbi:MAG: Fur family transcriptional regulator [bacterium]|jgi:Fur family ferric uptake transcriptional regulator
MRDEVSRARQELAAQDYKYTPQREIIVRVIAGHPDEHLSADEVYSLVRQKAPDVGMATVYRTLDLLERLKIIHRMNFGDGKSRYELCQANTHHHHHLVCLECGEITEVKKDLLAQLEETVARENDFTIVDHDLQFFGYCHKCRSRKDKTAETTD